MVRSGKGAFWRMVSRLTRVFILHPTALVWFQWCAIYLTDADIVALLKRCKKSLVPGGLIVLKENTCENEAFVLDVEDASLTRSLPYWRRLIQQAGLCVVLEGHQDNFPDDIFPVPMLALQSAPF